MLEWHKATALSDIERLTDEIGRARDDLDKPFTHASQLAAARERVREIDERIRQEPALPGYAPDQMAATIQEPDGPVQIARRDYPEGNPLPSR